MDLRGKNIQIWLTYGLPASGKSSWAKQQVEDSNVKTVRVNMDDIRSMLGFGICGVLPWSKELENTALMVQDQAILSAVKAGKDVIVDNTHIEEKMPKRIKRLFDGDVTFRVKDFTGVSVSDCIFYDNRRGLLGGHSVGADVIRKMAGRLSSPKWSLTEKYMNDVVLSPLYVPDQSKPLAIVYDLDGTVARHDHRSPYDYSRLDTDGLHTEIADIISKYSNYDGYFALALSGRPDVDNNRVQTLDWLYRKDVPCDHLFMRPADMLKDNDADVKQFLFDTHIRDNFNVEFWLDDRDRVVRRLRKLGIKVLQVADGDF
jgi:predicted ABC-type ATPase